VPRAVIDLYNRVAEAAGARFGDADRYRTEAAVTSGDRDRFDRFVASRDNGPRDGFVVLNGGGAFGAAKDWPTESFRSLALKITRELERDVVVTCGPAERDTARQIATASDRVFHAADEEPHLGLTKAIVSRAAAMVTTDSGPRHFAKPFGVPVVTLFGPTHVAWSETFDRLARHVQVDVDCGPCQQRVCPLGHHRCMTELTVGRVFDDVAATTGRVAPLAGAA
ncbi:MAG: glycosyltransferase family 9 protein, partial [Planctomycetota bacterium]